METIAYFCQMKRILLLSFFTAFYFTNITEISAQTWNPIGLNVVGHNTMNGVEALYQLSQCSGEDAVYVKLINHNSNIVSVEWYPAVFTNETKWHITETPADKKSVTLNPNASKEGDCSGSEPTMIILLKDFSVSINDFMRFGTTNFSVATQQ